MNFKKIKEAFTGFKKLSKRGKKYFAFLKTRNVVISLSLLFVSFLVFLLIAVFDRNVPYVFSISPEVAMPDEQLTIHGIFFGPEKGTSSVYISDIKVPVSAYEKWSRFEIIIRIPEEVTFGVVRVRNSYGFSNGKLFTGQKAIPRVEEGAVFLSRMPEIAELAPKTPVSGEILTLSGDAFGEAGAAERLLITSATYGKQITVPAYETQMWSDGEIRLIMPDGFFEGGTVTVITRYGESQPFVFRAAETPVRIRYGDEINVRADLTVTAVYNGETPAEAVIVLPTVFGGYRQIPIVSKGGRSRIVGNREFRFFPTEWKSKGEESQTLEMKVRLKGVAFEAVEDRFFADCGRAVQSLRIPQSFVSAVTGFVSGKESLSVFVAKVQDIFDNDFRFENPALIPDEETAGDPVPPDSGDGKTADGKTDAPRNQSGGSFAGTGVGDAFDFAALFADVLRSAGVEVRIVSGYLLVGEGRAVPHAWIEYRYPGFGMIPIDPTAGQHDFGYVSDETRDGGGSVVGEIGARYLALFDREEPVPTQLYRGYFVRDKEGLFSRQDFYAELSVPPENFDIEAPVLTDVRFR